MLSIFSAGMNNLGWVVIWSVKMFGCWLKYDSLFCWNGEIPADYPKDFSWWRAFKLDSQVKGQMKCVLCGRIVSYQHHQRHSSDRVQSNNIFFCANPFELLMHCILWTFKLKHEINNDFFESPFFIFHINIHACMLH